MESDTNIFFHLTLGFNGRRKNEFNLAKIHQRNRSYSTKEKLSKIFVPRPKPKETDICPSPISLSENEKNSFIKFPEQIDNFLIPPKTNSKNKLFGVSDIPEETHETEAISGGEEFSSKLSSDDDDDEKKISGEGSSYDSGDDVFDNCENIKNKIGYSNQKTKEYPPDIIYKKINNSTENKYQHSMKKIREKMNRIKSSTKKNRKNSDDIGINKRKKYFNDYKSICAQKFIDKIRNNKKVSESKFEDLKHNTISFNRNNKNYVTSILGYLEKNKAQMDSSFN